jgi:orotidine-5'-phosphate decarboxylase
MNMEPRMSSHPADRLMEAIERIGAPVCVGIDPVAGRLPDVLRPDDGAGPGTVVEAIGSYVMGVLDAAAGVAPCVKFQSACFERYGSAGVVVLERVMTAARQRGLEVVLDAKRGDIGISAEHYAAAASGADWITVNAYLGADGLRPFVEAGLGAFALVRTSNPSGDALQSQELAGGGVVSDAVAGIVAEVGASSIGGRGYSSLGAVVGATKRKDAARLRALMPKQIFLVPGYGAQGGGVEDVLPCFREGGSGAIVTASRSVIYAFEPGEADWTAPVRAAAERLADEIGRAVGMR